MGPIQTQALSSANVGAQDAANPKPTFWPRQVPDASIIGGNEGFLPENWSGLQFNAAHPGQPVVLPCKLESLNPKDFRIQGGVLRLPLPLLFCYGAGGDNSTEGGHYLCAQLPGLELSEANSHLDTLKAHGHDLGAIKNILGSKSIDLKDVPVYLNIRSVPTFPGDQGLAVPPGWDRNNMSTVVLNYFTHLWVHPEMVANADVPVETGVFNPVGIEGGPNGIGVNGLVSQGQNFHDGNYLSGNMHQLKVTQPTDEASQVASGWFLAIGPNKKAILSYELIVKSFAFDQVATDIGDVKENLKLTGFNSLQDVAGALGAVPIAGPALQSRLESVFRGFGLL